MSYRFILRLGLSTLLVSGLGLAACGGDDEDNGTNAGGSAGMAEGGSAGMPEGGTAGTAGMAEGGAPSTGGTAGAPSEGGAGGAAGGAAEIPVEDFGEANGETVQLYTLENENGLVAKLTNYGATLVEMHVPDRDGEMADVVHGFDNVEDYIAGSPFFGATIGRVANRIQNGEFELDGETIDLDPNSEDHVLHGGAKGWDKVNWTAEPMMTDDGPSVRFTYESVDGEEGFPGTVEATSTYTLTNNDELRIVMTAETDALTPVGMAHHSYWNLGGTGSGTIDDHVLSLYADDYTPAGDSGVPEGDVEPIWGTVFDFTRPKRIGDDLADVPGDPPVGYDHNWVVRGDKTELRMAARLEDPASGRALTIWADKPGIQFYTGNYMEWNGDEMDLTADPTEGKGAQHLYHSALCLESQAHPNSVNVDDWREDVLLEPGTTYSHTMVHAFTADAVEEPPEGAERFGRTEDGPAWLYTLENDNGLVAKLTNYGATLVEMWVPDRDGNLDDIVHGFSSVEQYVGFSPYFGATVGRVGNRIKNGEFELGGQTIDLDPNSEDHVLHGGAKGWDKVLWDAELMDTDDGPAILFTYNAPDGENGFPGNVEATSMYTLTNDNQLRIEMTAVPDEDTPINMVHHSYWNLAGTGSGTIDDHVLTLYASQYTPADPDSGVPEGEIEDVAGTIFDFTEPKRIGDDLGDVPGAPVGYDHNWIVDGDKTELRMAAQLEDPSSGRIMTIEADKPGIQFYTGNYMEWDGDAMENTAPPSVGKGVEHLYHSALCLETQSHPNSVNVDDWRDDVIVAGGDMYSHTMIHTFTTDE